MSSQGTDDWLASELLQTSHLGHKAITLSLGGRGTLLGMFGITSYNDWNNWS